MERQTIVTSVLISENEHIKKVQKKFQLYFKNLEAVQLLDEQRKIIVDELRSSIVAEILQNRVMNEMHRTFLLSTNEKQESIIDRLVAIALGVSDNGCTATGFINDYEAKLLRETKKVSYEKLKSCIEEIDKLLGKDISLIVDRNGEAVVKIELRFLEPIAVEV